MINTLSSSSLASTDFVTCNKHRTYYHPVTVGREQENLPFVSEDCKWKESYHHWTVKNIFCCQKIKYIYMYAKDYKKTIIQQIRCFKKNDPMFQMEKTLFQEQLPCSQQAHRIRSISHVCYVILMSIIRTTARTLSHIPYLQ